MDRGFRASVETAGETRGFLAFEPSEYRVSIFLFADSPWDDSFLHGDLPIGKHGEKSDEAT